MNPDCGDTAVFIAAVLATIASNMDVVVNTPTFWDYLAGLVLAIAVMCPILWWVERRDE